MKKKLFALAMAAAIALVAVPLALAAGGHDGTTAKPPAKGKPLLAKGTVVSVDATAGTLLVTVAKGSHNMKPFFRTDVTFTLAAGAHMCARTHGPHAKVHFKNASLDNVTPGSKVNINGRAARNSGGHAGGESHRPSAAGRPGQTHGAKAGHKTARPGSTSPGKSSRGAGTGVGKGSAHGGAAVALGQSGSAGRSAASGGGHPPGSTPKANPGRRGGT